MNGSIAANYPLDGATLIIILLILFDSYPLFPLSFLFKYVKTTVATVAYALKDLILKDLISMQICRWSLLIKLEHL